jgi:hypothetical protein
MPGDWYLENLIDGKFFLPGRPVFSGEKPTFNGIEAERI